jgi:PKHD-type hydroxylase
MTHSAPNPAWAFEIDRVENWAYWDNLFTPEECKQIIAIGNKKKPEVATIDNERIEKSSVRKSKVAWLAPADNMDWVYRRVTDVALALNAQYFGFELFGITEGFQFTKYESSGSFYGPHIDKMHNGTVRKLSLVIQLSDPKDYKGGDLKLHYSSQPIATPKAQGKLVAFPSYVLHEVTPVTKGTRYTLVCWITGKPFK